jgi:predicted metalloprotease with PDZ domain
MKSQHAPVHYEIACADVHAHLFRITLTVAEPAALQVLQLPVWIPGSYLVREFAKHLLNLRCTQNGKPVPTEQTDKSHWQVRCDPSQPLQAQYEVYARDASVRAAWLDAQRGFFNGTSMCLRVLGQEAQPHTLTLAASNAPSGWSLATGLSPLPRGELRRPGRLPGGDGALLEWQLPGPRHPAPLCGRRCRRQL